MEKEKPSFGGQAVIEGVMIRGKKYYVVSVRKNGKLLHKTCKIKKRPEYCKLPIIRGIVSLIDSLVVGIKSLNWSASQAGDEGEDIPHSAIVLAITFSFLFGIFLFIFLPYLFTYLLGINESAEPVKFNIVDGIIKIAILIFYTYLISLMKDIHKVFQYHGAEHKAVNCLENNEKLTVSNAKKYSTLHPRCGTSFIFIVLFLAVFLFSFIPMLAGWLFPAVKSMHWFPQRIILFSIRILFLPLIAGISYEILKLSGRRKKSRFLNFFTKPGLWIQKITTKEPTGRQLEVGIASLKKVMALEK